MNHNYTPVLLLDILDDQFGVGDAFSSVGKQCSIFSCPGDFGAGEASGLAEHLGLAADGRLNFGIGVHLHHGRDLHPQVHVGRDDVAHVGNHLTLVPALVRLDDVVDGQLVGAGVLVVLQAEPLVPDEQLGAGGDRQRVGVLLRLQTHPQDRIFVAILDRASQLDRST